ncbi:MAG TPA: SpoIIE family protein phosphatase [Candidatus Eisenbacteria bacterium]|nr:SpoIIE family protein phosphatase [Candidatus Eisenbacteria bacterium]
MKFLFKRSDATVQGAAPTAADLPLLVGAEIAGLVHGRRVGGDFYQFARANAERVVFGLLDVAGDCNENRGIVAAAREAFREKGPACLARDEVNEADAMMEFCQELNFSIRSAAKGVRSCAAFLGCYNEGLGTVCYVNAGHTPGLLRYEGSVSALPATGMPLGLFAGSTYEAPTAAIPKGGALLLASRGVVEATRKREEYGLERLREHFAQMPLASAHDVASAALEGVRQFANSAVQQNDLTTLAVLRPGTIR